MAQPKTTATIDQIKEKHEMNLMAIPGVSGVGIGEDPRKPGRVIKVYVERITPELKQKIPAKVDGYSVSIEQTGEFRAV
jgi:hypothetical protein